MTRNDRSPKSTPSASSADDIVSAHIQNLTEQIQALRLDLELTKTELRLTRSQLRSQKTQLPQKPTAKDIFEIGDIVKITNSYRNQKGITGTVISIGTSQVTFQAPHQRTGKLTEYKRKFTNLELIRRN